MWPVHFRKDGNRASSFPASSHRTKRISSALTPHDLSPHRHTYLLTLTNTLAQRHARIPAWATGGSALQRGALGVLLLLQRDLWRIFGLKGSSIITVDVCGLVWLHCGPRVNGSRARCALQHEGWLVFVVVRSGRRMEEDYYSSGV